MKLPTYPSVDIVTVKATASDAETYILKQGNANLIELSPFEQRYQQVAEASGGAWFPPEKYAGLCAFWKLALQREKVELAKILEIGCGVGNLAVELASDGHEVTGIDISPTAIAIAAERFGLTLGTHFICADVAQRLPFEDHSFDVVIDSDCLHHLIGESRSSFFRESRRVLTGDGKLFVKTIVGQPLEDAWQMLNYDSRTRTSSTYGKATNYYVEAEELLQEVSAAAFAVLNFGILPAPADGAGSPQAFLICQASS